MSAISLLFQSKRICLFINFKPDENAGHFHFALYAYFLGFFQFSLSPKYLSTAPLVN